MSPTESSASPCASQAIIAAVEAPDGARFGGRLCGNRARLQHLARRLHALGPRPLFHYLDEVECGRDSREHLETYARLDPDVSLRRWAAHTSGRRSSLSREGGSHERA